MAKNTQPAILITGANGYIGKVLLKKLVQESARFRKIVAVDIRETIQSERLANVYYECADIRSEKMGHIFKRYGIDIAIHLAAIVTPGRKNNHELEYSVDVLGTRNILQACVGTGVEKIILASSGAAYGYHADNPQWLVEGDALRGNPEFAYSDHKRQVEEMLATFRDQHPELQQLIFRPGTVLGASVRNQITALFEKKLIPGLRGASTPFVFIWDEDVAACIAKGIFENKTGIYNLAGDGTLSLREIASLQGKPFIALPVWVVKTALLILKKLHLSQYGPEQVNFLRYRPVLSNRKLKEDFGYTPKLSTKQVFEFYLQAKRKAALTRQFSLS